MKANKITLDKIRIKNICSCEYYTSRYRKFLTKKCDFHDNLKKAMNQSIVIRNNQIETHNKYTRIAFLIAIIALYLFKVVITGSFSF